MRIFIFFISLFLICCQGKQKKKKATTVKQSKAVIVETLKEKETAKDKDHALKIKKKVVPKLEAKVIKANNNMVSSYTIDYKTKDYSAVHKEALAYCKKKNFHKGYYFLLDYSIHSGKNRFFIYDFEKEKIVNAKLVTHGACDVFEANYSMWDSAVFSDRPNSHCSSKGKYKVGKRDYSGWGINVKYWIKGLEDSNKSAEKRVVVLHSWGLVSDAEVYPDYSPLSWGCPAVSNSFMESLDELLKKTRKPVLLWIVD